MRIIAITTGSGIDRLIVGVIRSAGRLRQIFAGTAASIDESPISQLPPRVEVVRLGARSASRGCRDHRSPALHSSEFRANEGLRAWRGHIPYESVDHLDPRFARARFRSGRRHAALQSRKFAHDRYAAALSGMVPGVRDNPRDVFRSQAHSSRGSWNRPHGTGSGKGTQNTCLVKHGVYSVAHVCGWPESRKFCYFNAPSIGLPCAISPATAPAAEGVTNDNDLEIRQ